MRFRVAVVLSGRGSNLEALLGALGIDGPASVVVVLSNREAAGGLEVARRHGIATHLFNDSADAEEWERVLGGAGADLVVLAGYLRRVPGEVVRAWEGRMINIHPSLLPKHGGPGMYGGRVHAAVLAAGEPTSGATVHLVTEEYDRGPILGQAAVPVMPGDTPELLAARVLRIEHRLLPAAVLAAASAGRAMPFSLDQYPVGQPLA